MIINIISLNAFLHSIEKEFLQPFVSEGFYHFVNVTYAVTLVKLYLARRSKQYYKRVDTNRLPAPSLILNDLSNLKPEIGVALSVGGGSPLIVRDKADVKIGVSRYSYQTLRKRGRAHGTWYAREDTAHSQ